MDPTTQGTKKLKATQGKEEVASAPEVLKSIRDADTTTMGMDIGGTLTKLAIALPLDVQGSTPRIPRHFGETGTSPPELDFNCEIQGHPWRVSFVKGSTSRMETLLSAPQLRGLFTAGLSETRQLVAAGGGAHKFHELFQQSMGVDLVAFKEFQAFVDGLRMLAELQPADELFTVNADGEEDAVSWESGLVYPFLLVSCGSGVSILKVNSRSPNDFERVGGTAIGGATFLGLMRVLTSAKTFQEAVDLAAQGDASKVDKTVGDIYGSEGCLSLNMSAHLTASNFGKLAFPVEGESVSEADIARAVLTMVAQATCVVVRTVAQQSPVPIGNRVFIGGGFIDDNPLARMIFSKTLSNLNGRAVFARHSAYLGALGSLSHSFALKAPHALTHNNLLVITPQTQPRAYFREVTGASELAECWWKSGIVWLCFRYFLRAKRCFEACLNESPNCAMGHWGIAYSLARVQWSRVSVSPMPPRPHRRGFFTGPSSEEAGRPSLGRRRSSSIRDESELHELEGSLPSCALWEIGHNAASRASTVVQERSEDGAIPAALVSVCEESKLIEALGLLFVYPQSSMSPHLRVAFISAFRELSETYPLDPDVHWILAESLMDSMEYPVNSQSAQQPSTTEVTKILDGQLETSPCHIGLWSAAMRCATMRADLEHAKLCREKLLGFVDETRDVPENIMD